MDLSLSTSGHFPTTPWYVGLRRPSPPPPWSRQRASPPIAAAPPEFSPDPCGVVIGGGLAPRPQFLNVPVLVVEDHDQRGGEASALARERSRPSLPEPVSRPKLRPPQQQIMYTTVIQVSQGLRLSIYDCFTVIVLQRQLCRLTLHHRSRSGIGFL